MKSAFFTGHRNIHFTSHNIRGINQLINYALSNEITQFHIGMALGSDLLCAKICSERNLNWIAVLPCLDQTEKWNKSQQEIYDKLLEKASFVTLISQKYYEGCMQKRNLYMIENSELCLAIYDESEKGGTAFTVKSAIKKGLPVMKFNPNNRNFILVKDESKFSQLEFILI